MDGMRFMKVEAAAAEIRHEDAWNLPLEKLLQRRWWRNSVDAVYVNLERTSETTITGRWFWKKEHTVRTPVWRIRVWSESLYFDEFGTTPRFFCFEDENEVARLVEIMKKRLPLVCIEK